MDLDESEVEFTGETDRGANGTIELKFRGLRCAGKKEKSDSEAELLSSLRHPNIVLFIGRCRCYLTGPILVTEFLATLKAHLDTGQLPDPYSYSILKDVAAGLYFLHEHKPNPVIHGDLTASNILVTDRMHAKISNFEVAVTVPKSKPLLNCPGTKEYMPPNSPVYFTDIDIFSFGVLLVHTFSGESPMNLDYRNEDDRHMLLMERIGRDHPLENLADQCLSIDKEKRPRALSISYGLYDVCERLKIEDYLQNMYKEHHSLQSSIDKMDKKIKELESDCGELADEQRNTAGVMRLRTAFLATTHNLEIDDLKREKQHLEDRIRDLNQRIEKKEEDMTITLKSKNNEISWKDEIICSKDKMISGLKDIISSISTTHMHPLNIKHKLSWMKVPGLPFGITAPQYVVIGTTLYVGGGKTTTNNSNSEQKVLCYTLDSREWKCLPPSPYMYFGLGLYLGNLITVGGSLNDGCDSVTGDVLQFDNDSMKWMPVKSSPPMPTPRRRLCVASFQSASFQSGIIAVGGIDVNDIVVDTVEVLFLGQWNRIASLPQPRAALSTTVQDNIAYFSGGFYPDLQVWNDGMMDCYSINLSLIHSGSGVSWRVLSPVPFRCSAIVKHCGTLLAIGGRNGSGEITDEIHAYNAGTNNWLHIDQTGFKRSSMIVATITENDIIVVGGWEPKQSKEVKAKCVMRAYV